MFSDDTGKPYLDLKHEYHPEYFETLGKILPGMKKVIERSFISEHMLMKKDIMQSLIRDIEANDNIPGDKFWEKIINCIEPEKIYDSSFSEFETYGTYVALKYSSLYRLREWHSFRLGGSFFKIDTICDRDFIWLGKDFDAISFEKGQEGSGENYHFFDNPEYQQKLSAKKMLQIAQMEYRDGYKEIWGDDLSVDKNANVRVGGYHTGKKEIKNTLIVVVSYNGLFFMQANIQSIRETLTPGTYKIVVVDNASTDGVTQWLDEQKDILLIKNTENVIVDIKKLPNEHIDAIKNIHHVYDVQYAGDKLTIKCNGGRHNITHVIEYLSDNNLNYDRIYSELPTLNDVFLEITGKELRDKE
jgi:hypothetical protein